MKMTLSLAFATCLVLGLVGLFWVVGILGQRPAIPVQTPEVSYFEIILHKKKRNPIDDHYPLARPETSEMQPRGSI